MKSYRTVTIHPDVASSSLAKMLAGTAALGESPKISDYRTGKKHLFLSPLRGDIFHICASLDTRYICCSTHVISHISNCPFECTYCFLQNYLTDTTLTVIADSRAILEEIRSRTSLQPWRLFRIGTWELGDSLALAPLNHAAVELINGFRDLPNCILKLRTKSSDVAPILDADHGGKTVVSWTLNPPEIIAREEIGTARLDARLRAMEQVAAAGYPVGIHLDPLILFEGWEQAYERLVKDLFSAISPRQVIWISMGSLRFNPEMKKKIENNYPASTITAQEMVLGDDNKFRYLRPLRVEMYRHVLELLKAAGAGECFTYLCMERWNVWQEVFGRHPSSIGHLDYLMAMSVRERFPSMCACPPEKERYLALEY
jgi:spore photoproduct lyase